MLDRDLDVDKIHIRDTKSRIVLVLIFSVAVYANAQLIRLLFYISKTGLVFSANFFEILKVSTPFLNAFIINYLLLCAWQSGVHLKIQNRVLEVREGFFWGFRNHRIVNLQNYVSSKISGQRIYMSPDDWRPTKFFMIEAQMNLGSNRIIAQMLPTMAEAKFIVEWLEHKSLKTGQ